MENASLFGRRFCLSEGSPLSRLIADSSPFKNGGAYVALIGGGLVDKTKIQISSPTPLAFSALRVYNQLLIKNIL